VEFLRESMEGGRVTGEMEGGNDCADCQEGRGRKSGGLQGVTLMSTLYKVYMSVLAERLREEVKAKRVVPHNQTGFKKEMGIIYNIYVLNYLVNRQLR